LSEKKIRVQPTIMQRFLGILPVLLIFSRTVQAFIPTSKTRSVPECQLCSTMTEQDSIHKSTISLISTRIMAQKNMNDSDDDIKTTKDDDDYDPVDVFIAEQEASRKVANRLMLPRMVATSISQTISAFAWTFLILSFVLQICGYSFMMDESGLRIDTLEARQFQEEITKNMKDRSR
jgi:hypothetical protein